MHVILKFPLFCYPLPTCSSDMGSRRTPCPCSGSPYQIYIRTVSRLTLAGLLSTSIAFLHQQFQCGVCTNMAKCLSIYLCHHRSYFHCLLMCRLRSCRTTCTCSGNPYQIYICIVSQLKFAGGL